MRPISNKRHQRQRGNAIVEFALASTLLLTMFVGVTGFSRIFNIANMAAGAAQAGVAYGTLSPTHSGDLTGMQTAALNDTGNYPGATAVASQWCACSVGGPVVDCSTTCNNSKLLKYVQVQVTIPYTTVISYPTLPNPVNITQSAVGPVQ